MSQQILKGALAANTITLDNETTPGTLIIKKGEPGTEVMRIADTGQTIKGTTTNDNAAAGYVGEYVESVVTAPTTGAVAGVQTNITSISLTAGDWDISWYAELGISPTTTFSYLRAAVGTVSAILVVRPMTVQFPTPAVVNLNATVNGVDRLSLATTTTVYLVAQASFAVSTAGFGGRISARRVR